jgi:ABC-type transporter Mla subunit MlaD
LDSYLPNGAQGEKHKSEEIAAVYEETGKTRTSITVSKLGLISTHLKQAGETKLRELQLQGPVHKAIAHQAYELVSYSAAVLHLDTLGDSVAQRVADSQHQLFQAAANVKVKAQNVIESHPTLLSIEKAVEPYAAMTQNLATAVAMRVLTVVAAGSDLATNFFENRYADLQTILNRSAKYSAETIESWRKEHPDFDARITALVDTLRASFSSTVDTIRRLSSLSKEQLATAYSSIFHVISTVELTFAAFRKQLLSSAKFQLSLPSHQNVREFEGSPSAPEEEGDPSQAVEEEEEHPDSSSHKSKRQKKHHKH